jgi:KUP system potassium uptake protein
VTANLAKILDGGWVPLSLAAVLLALAMVWRWGRRRLAMAMRRRTMPLDVFLARTDVQSARRVPGSAIVLTSITDGIPPILIHQLERTGILHRQVVLLSILTLDIPFVDPRRRLQITELGLGLNRIVARFGYKETPDVPRVLEACAIYDLVVDIEQLTYILGRESLRLRRAHGPLSWHRRLFSFLARNQAPAVGSFGMPVERVIEIGMQLDL